MSDDIKKILNAKDAKDDIAKIDEVLGDSAKFNRNAIHVYNELYYKLEYKPYISVLVLSKKLYGTTPFDKLKFIDKLKVLKIIRQAICNYLAKEIGEEIIKSSKEKI